MFSRKVVSGGRALTIRPVSAEDVDGLEALYRTLSEEDRYRRFFTAILPSRQLVERFARIELEGGFRLVAVAEDDGIVAEAGYGVMPDGEAEFSLTVASRWRGWLGPYLLHLLVVEAAARGVTNLEAQILAENRQMLAVVAARGCVVLDHPDWTTVHLAIGAAHPMPVWPEDAGHPRLLVETSAMAAWSGTAAARAAGFTVIGCPISSAVRHRRCPALAGQACPLASGADVILVTVGADDPVAAALVEAHRRLHTHVPVCVETRAGGEPPAWAPAGTTLIDRRRDATERVATLTAAL